MSQRQSALLTAMAIALALPVAAPNAADVSAQDRTKLVDYLTKTRDQVLAESSKLTEAQWNFKPGPDRWSVGQVVEHLALAESYIFDLQQKAMTGPPATPEQQAATTDKDAMIMKAIPDRTQKAQAPEPLQPGKLGSRADVLKAFKDRRAKTLEYARKTKDDLRARVGESPLGPLDGYQWLLFMAAHSERHLAQIKEVKADAQFPKAGTQ